MDPEQRNLLYCPSHYDLFTGSSRDDGKWASPSIERNATEIAQEVDDSSSHPPTMSREERVENIARHFHLYLPYLIVTGRVNSALTEKGVVLVKDFVTTLFSVFPHFIPIASVVAFLSFAHLQFYFGNELNGPSGGDSFKFFGLQIAAKLLELLFVSALKSIVFTVVRQELTRGHGMPFAAINAASQVAEPSFLWSKEFWALCTAKDSGKNYGNWRRAKFIVLIILCSGLAIAIAPASATALTPKRLQFPAGGTNVYLNGTRDQIFITELNNTHVVDGSCIVAGDHDLCPSKGWNAIRDSLIANIPNQFSTGSFIPNLPPSISMRGVKSIFRLSVVMRDHGLWSVIQLSSTAMMPHMAVADAVAKFSDQWYSAMHKTNNPVWNRWKYGTIDQAGTDTYSPVVTTLCKYSPYDPNDSSMPLVVNFTQTSPTSTSISFDSGTREWIADLVNTTAASLRWFDVPNDIAGNSSIGALIAVPNATEIQMFGCLCSARWRKSRVLFDSVQSLIEVSPDKDKSLHGGSSDWLGDTDASVLRHISIDQSFARYLNPWTSTDKSSDVLNEFVIAAGMWQWQLGQGTHVIYGYEAESLVETFLNTMIVNGISRSSPHLQQIGTLIDENGAWYENFFSVHGHGPDPVAADGSFHSYSNNAWQITEAEEATSFSMRMFVLVSGYAYSPHDTAIGISIVILYVCLAVTSIFIVSSMVTRVSSSAWESPNELLALALNSPQAAENFMKGYGAGTTTIQSLRQMVHFREKNGKVELRPVDDDPTYRKLEYNKKYV